MKKWLKLLSAALLFLPAAASAQWTTDYSKNTQVTPVGLNYDENEVVTNDDGITYAFFIIQSNGTLDMRLQILDKQGNKVMERGGHSVSHEANKVWSPYNQHLALDNKGNVFVGVQDFRTAPEQSLNSYTIYKYSPEGELLWEGTTLNAGKGYATQLGLSLCGLDDGGCACAYVYRDDATGMDCIAMERLGADGKQVWNKTVLRTRGEPGTYPYPYLAKGDGGNIIMLYIAGGNTLKAHVTDGDGNALAQEDATVYSGGFASSKPWEVMRVTPCAGGEAIVTCMNSEHNSVFTRITADGMTAFAGMPGGVTLNDAEYGGAQPAVAYVADSDCYICAYQQFDRNDTNNQGLYLRRVNTDGTAAEATAVAAMQTGYMYSFYSVQDAGNGHAALFYQKCDKPAQIVDSFMEVYDAGGNKAGDATKFTETLTMKQNLKSSAMIDGKYFITSWDEDRYGSMSLFMQKVEYATGTGINTPAAGTEIVKSETFTAGGIKTSGTVKGVNIIRTTHTDGSVTVKKIADGR